MSMGIKSSNDNNIILTIPMLFGLIEYCKEKDNDYCYHILDKLVSFSDGKTPLNTDILDVLRAEEYNNCCDEQKVDVDFADYIQNIHDSYYEGGLTADDTKNAINDYGTIKFGDTQISGNPVMQLEIVPNGDNYGVAEKEENNEKEEELDSNLENQIAEIISLSTN